MTRPTMLLVVLCMFADVAHAHAKIVRLQGNVSSVSEIRISITTTKGKLRSVILSNATMYLRDDSPITLKHITAGEDIVIRATREHHQLIAAEVIVGAFKTLPKNKSRAKTRSSGAAALQHVRCLLLRGGDLNRKTYLSNSFFIATNSTTPRSRTGRS
jgi:hypothetical protein